MPKKHKPKTITIRLPPVVATRLEQAIEAAVERFEEGLLTIKPTLNAFVVQALDGSLATLEQNLAASRRGK